MKKNGFTLIELLVVITIIAILAGIVVGVIGGAKGLRSNKVHVDEDGNSVPVYTEPGISIKPGDL